MREVDAAAHRLWACRRTRPASAPSTASSIGYVFQDATLLPWRTVQRNVELNAELQGMPKAEREAKAAEAIKLVNLVGHEAKYPKQLSGGMRMRCSLARSLVLNPKVFLFDEPFGALDEITRERLNSELLDLFLREQFAGLFITHSVSEAVFLSTRVLVMSARPGRIDRRHHDSVRIPATPGDSLRPGVRRDRRPCRPRAQGRARDERRRADGRRPIADDAAS